MKAVPFKGQNIVIAENQPQYESLPAFVNPCDGTITYCFELTDEDMANIEESRKVYFQQTIGNSPQMQPIYPTTNRDEVLPLDEAVVRYLVSEEE